MLHCPLACMPLPTPVTCLHSSAALCSESLLCCVGLLTEQASGPNGFVEWERSKGGLAATGKGGEWATCRVGRPAGKLKRGRGDGNWAVVVWCDRVQSNHKAACCRVGHQLGDLDGCLLGLNARAGVLPSIKCQLPVPAQLPGWAAPAWRQLFHSVSTPRISSSR